MTSLEKLCLIAAACLAVILPLGAAQAQSMGGAVTMINRPATTGTVQCMKTSRAENAKSAAETNRLRSASGLPALSPNARLAEAASRHACDMARRSKMTHTGSQLRRPSHRVRAVGYNQSIVAENIAKGFTNVEQVMGAWINSQSHRGNIMLPQAREFGIGRAVGADGRTVFWAAVYAAQR